MKKFAREIIPPFILKTVKYLLRFQRTYISYNEALKNCSNPNGYQDDELVRVLVEETKEYLITLDKDPIKLDDQTTVYTLIPFTFLCSRKVINVLDIGGGCGMHFYPLKKVFSNKFKFNWHVVETNALSQAAKVLENDELKFFDNISKAVNSLERIDLIISSGAIQYFEDPRQVLKEIVEVGAEYILLLRLSLSTSNRDIISVQRSLLSQNGYEILPQGYKNKIIDYPHTNMNENDFHQILHTNYITKICLDDKSGVQHINNYPTIGYGLLLEKIH
jgi:putative methyltransferase (TIGR04325 family)